jgi:predicted ATPase
MGSREVRGLPLVASRRLRRPPGALLPGSLPAVRRVRLGCDTELVAPPALVKLRVSAFKSYRNQELIIEPLTLLVGRNGSGKSNALDALSLLALLADERDVSDVERGDQEVAGLRGGLTGAAPFGEALVKVGCSVRTSDGNRLDLDVTLDASSHPEIVAETLVLRDRGVGKTDIVLLDAHRQSAGSGISNVQVYSGGQPRLYTLLSSRLAAAQSVTKVPEDSRARRLVVASCVEAMAALRGIFVLDPVPAQMRQYSRIGSLPDRSGSTVSAMAYALRSDKAAWERLSQLLAGLLETDLKEITFSEGRLPEDRLVDVMVALVEQAGSHTFTAPARVMSDGTLRYLAIVASLLSLSSEQPTPAISVRRTLVVEEIENGLFPSQAAGVLDLLRAEAHAQDVRLIATTHSPALLDALGTEDHAGVIICDRASDGWSRLQRLVDHPRYVDVAGGGSVGRAVTEGMLDSRVLGTPTTLADLFS